MSAILLALIMIVSVAAAPPDTASAALPPPPADRISGSDRYATAVAVSERAFPEGADLAVLVTGSTYLP